MKNVIILLSLLTIYSCGKSNTGDSNPVGNIVNENDPCKTSSLCSQEKQVRTIDDLRIIERDSRRNRVDESYTIGYTLQETAIFLNNEYNWETNTFSGDCVEASDTVKTVYKINYNQVDEDGDKYDEFITKVSKTNRRLIT